MSTTTELFLKLYITILVGYLIEKPIHSLADLPDPGIKPASSALEARSLTHWTTREVSQKLILTCSQEWTVQKHKRLQVIMLI